MQYHKRTVPFPHLASKRLPSRLNDAEVISSSAPKTKSSAPVPGSQMRAVSSRDAMTIRDPLGWKETETTADACPRNSDVLEPVRASNRRAVPSSDMTRILVPSGLQAARVIALGATRVLRSAP